MSVENIYTNPMETRFKRYDTQHMGVGKRFQRLDTMAAQKGDPWLTTPFNQVPSSPPSTQGNAMNMFRNANSCCPTEEKFQIPEGQMWGWTKEGRLRLACEQPIVPVPIVQEIHRRDRIIEVPQVEVVDAVQPKVYNQDVKHQVAQAEIMIKTEPLAIPQLRYKEKEVIVPLVTGYTHKFVPKWEIREVPRPVVKYTGEQKIIEIEVPQIKFVDKIIEREVVIDTVEKKVAKITEIENPVETVQYVWKPIEKIVHIETIVPKFDVSLECPSPLLVPYPVKKVKEMPSVMVRKSIGQIDSMPVQFDDMPPGTIRVPLEYIDEYSKISKQANRQVWPSNCFDCCSKGVETEQTIFTPEKMVQLFNEAEQVQNSDIEGSGYEVGEVEGELTLNINDEEIESSEISQ